MFFEKSKSFRVKKLQGTFFDRVSVFIVSSEAGSGELELTDSATHLACL